MPQISYILGNEPLYTQADVDALVCSQTMKMYAEIERLNDQVKLLNQENHSYDLTLTKVMGALEGDVVYIRNLQAEIARLRNEIQNAAYEQQLDANAAVAANDAAAKFQAENDALRKALREVINRAVLETGTTWKDTANDMAQIAHGALMPF